MKPTAAYLAGGLALTLALLFVPRVAGALTGPVFPPPGGVTFTSTGASAGDPGGITFSFTGFDSGAFVALYWGPQDGNAVQAGLDATSQILSFASTSGQTSTWSGTANYNPPPPFPSGIVVIPIFLDITVNGLGASPWVLASSVPALDPSVGAVVDNSAGSNFTATLEFFADLSSLGGPSRMPLNSVQQFSSGLTVSAFTGGFFAEEAPPLDHFVCYRIKENKWREKDVVVENQFGEFFFTLTKPELLCVPSSKTELE